MPSTTRQDDERAVDHNVRGTVGVFTDCDELEDAMGYAQVWCTGFRRRLDPRQLAWAPRRGSGRPR